MESIRLELFKTHVDVTFRDTVSWWVWQCWVILDDLKGIFQSKQFSGSRSLSPQLSPFPTIPTVPWQPPALLPPLHNCQIFLFPGHNPHFISPRGAQRFLASQSSAERGSSGDWVALMGTPPWWGSRCKGGCWTGWFVSEPRSVRCGKNPNEVKHSILLLMN